MSHARRILYCALALLATAAGCARDLATCDITESACQQTIYYRLLALRGDGYDPFGGLPPVTVITEDEFRAYLEEAEANRASQSGPNPWDTALALLHFTGGSAPNPDGGALTDGGDAGSSVIDDEVAHVLAYYSSETKSVTVISHPTQTDPDARENAMITLAHELVHALQDRELDLGADVSQMSVDEYFAVRKGLVEGDARFYEYLFGVDLYSAAGRRVRAATDLPDVELAYAYQHFDELGSPFFAAEYLMYPLGAKRLAAAYRSGGNAAVRHGYGKMPKQTVSFLVIGADGEAPPPTSGEVCPPPAIANPPSVSLARGGDRFGAVAFYTFLRGWGVDHATAFVTAQSWTGDYMQIQADEDLTTVAVAWRLEFSKAPPATIAALVGASGELAVTTGSASLVITAAASATPVDWRATTNCPN